MQRLVASITKKKIGVQTGVCKACKLKLETRLSTVASDYES